MKSIYLFLFVSLPVFSFENCTSENINDLERCSYSNYTQEDAYLNYLCKGVISSYPELKEKVRETQRAWIVARDKICNFNLTDGEEYKVYQNTCLYLQTYERNRELNAIILRKQKTMSETNKEISKEWSDYVKTHCQFMKDIFSDNDCEDRNYFLHNQ